MPSRPVLTVTPPILGPLLPSKVFSPAMLVRPHFLPSLVVPFVLPRVQFLPSMLLLLVVTLVTSTARLLVLEWWVAGCRAEQPFPSGPRGHEPRKLLRGRGLWGTVAEEGFLSRKVLVLLMTAVRWSTYGDETVKVNVEEWRP